jgi:hypothetical protein
LDEFFVGRAAGRKLRSNGHGNGDVHETPRTMFPSVYIYVLLTLHIFAGRKEKLNPNPKPPISNPFSASAVAVQSKIENLKSKMSACFGCGSPAHVPLR